MPGLEPGTLFRRQTLCSIELHRREYWSGQQDSNLRTLVSKTSPYSRCGTPGFENWLRVEDSNLYLLVQSQPSCLLDEPEIMAGKAGLEPARFSLKN